jgi:hypothetical protein
MERAPRPLTALLTALVVVTATGCRRASDPVLDFVETLRTAAEDRDAQAIADQLADDFKGSSGIDKTEAAATLRRYFAGYESIRLAVYDTSVTRSGDDGAEVAFRAEMTGSARHIGGLDGFLPPSAVERFTLRLVRQGARWRVVSAEWTAVEPVASAAP